MDPAEFIARSRGPLGRSLRLLDLERMHELEELVGEPVYAALDGERFWRYVGTTRATEGVRMDVTEESAEGGRTTPAGEAGGGRSLSNTRHIDAIHERLRRIEARIDALEAFGSPPESSRVGGVLAED